MVAKRQYLARHGIVRNAIKDDLLYFVLPGLGVFSAALFVSGRDGYDGLTSTLWGLVKNPENLGTLSAMNITGLTLYVVGFTTAIIAVVTLGRFYASTLVIREDHKLITHGLYRFSRHPIYLGVIVICFGVPAYASSLYGFLTMSVLIPIILNRIRMEERLLVDEFGDEYRSYRESTRMLVPFIF